MLLSYALMYVLAPLMPDIMNGVGLDTASAARASSLLDVARLGCFVALFVWSGWHGRKLPILTRHRRAARRLRPGAARLEHHSRHHG